MDPPKGLQLDLRPHHGLGITELIRASSEDLRCLQVKVLAEPQGSRTHILRILGFAHFTGLFGLF